jgi:GNAT superfamily N-acetyltransferase
MAEIVEETYRRPDLPRELEIQVLAFGRMAWFDEPGSDPFRERLHDEPDAMHFVRRAGSLLISHVRVVPRRIEGADDRTISVAGLGGVMTFPAFRAQGHASALMRRAEAYIGDAGFELGWLFCEPSNEGFYERLGWRPLAADRVRVRGGPAHEGVMTLGNAALLRAVTELEDTW